jgi:hypothetical protein
MGKAFVIGYSLDACVKVRELILEGHEVTLFKTGPLGGYYDTTYDWLLEDPKELLEKLETKHRMRVLENGFFVDLGRSLGLFYDINEFGHTKMPLAPLEINPLHFVKEFMEANNPTLMLKSAYGKQLYETVVAALGSKKYLITQTQASKGIMAAELGIEHIASGKPYVLYRPYGGFVSLCEKLTLGATVKEKTIQDIRHLFTKPAFKNPVYMMDNRIDYVLDYVLGPIARISLRVEPRHSKKQNIVVKTPTMPSWAYTEAYTKGFRNEAYAIYSDKIKSLSDVPISVLVPTKDNAKIIKDYTDLVAIRQNLTVDIRQIATALQ